MLGSRLSPARPGEGIALSWSAGPDLAMKREAGPAESQLAHVRADFVVPLVCRYSILPLVVVSESPDLPVGPAVSGEGIGRVDSCVRLVPST